MVQRKVSNKLGIQAKSVLKPDKRHATTNHCLQNYDARSKVADMKAIRMKKLRSIRQPDVGFSLRPQLQTREAFRMPGEPPTAITPTKTPSPKKTAFSGNKTSPYSSPNYMKSTSSSELRKENPVTKENCTTSLNTLHRVGKALGKSSSLERVRTLTKAPSFKHTRNGACNKKVVLCKNLEAERATCSSTLKDSKFPVYLKLSPGATEAEGTSVMKVCPYSYCSLNGHRHAVVPPLKSFLSSRRRMLKSQKTCKPEGFSSGNRKRPEIKVTEGESEMSFVLSGITGIQEDENDDFYVEGHVPRHEVSETIDFQDDVNLSEMNFSSEENTDEECPSTPFEGFSNAIDLDMASDSSVNLDQLFGEISDTEWEEGQITTFHDERIEVQKDYSDDESELEKFVAEKLLPYIHDEIMECLQFSDAETQSDSESRLTEDDYTEEQVLGAETICTSLLEEESIEEQDSGFLNLVEEVTDDSNEDLDSIKERNEINGDDYDEDLDMVEGAKEGVPMKKGLSSESEIVNEENNEEQQIPMAENDSQAEGYQNEQIRNKEDESLCISVKCQEPDENLFRVLGVSSTSHNQDHDSNEVRLNSFESHVVEIKALETEDNSQTEEEAALPAIENKSQQAQKRISNMRSDSIDELLDSCNKLKKSVRRKISEKDSEESREFNPRPPNFLPVEPEQDPEKVDLRHQDMDERRNSEDWMLDHALQKTVSQLATARKRKVALLVEAFECVLPTPKNEPHIRRNSSGFSHARPIQACS